MDKKPKDVLGLYIGLIDLGRVLGNSAESVQECVDRVIDAIRENMVPIAELLAEAAEDEEEPQPRREHQRPAKVKKPVVRGIPQKKEHYRRRRDR